jgi:hypothetical protein
MEKTMLNTLQFNLTVPTPYVFVARCLKAAAADREVFYLQIPCIMDCPLLDGDYMKLYKVSFETKLTIWQSF